MARHIRTIFNLNLSSYTKGIINQTTLRGARTLYTEDSVGVPNYVATREKMARQYDAAEDKFRNKMQEFVEQENSMIFTDDLKTMMHLAKKTPEDLELVYKMLKKFNMQNREIRFGTFVFGPIIMRMLYHLDEPQLAYKLFNDEALDSMFDQIGTYKVMFMLFYKHNMYQEIIDCYDKIMAKAVGGVKHPLPALIYAFLACYKLNTPESFQYAVNLWKDLNSMGIEIGRRSCAFMAALALAQNTPQIALEIATGTRRSEYVDFRCMKLEALAMMNRVDEVINCLKVTVEKNQMFNKKLKYFIDTIEKVEQHLKANEVPEDSEVYALIEQMKLNGFVQEQSLADHLIVPIRSAPPIREGGMVDDQSFQRQRRTSFYYTKEGEQGFNQQRRTDNQNRMPQRRADLYNMV